MFFVTVAVTRLYFPAKPCTSQPGAASCAVPRPECRVEQALPTQEARHCCTEPLMVPLRSLLSTATLKWGVFGVDRQQKGHICDDVSAGIKEHREGTARGKQMEKPPGDPRVEQGLVTTACPSAVMWCSSKVAKRCVHRNSSALPST